MAVHIFVALVIAVVVWFAVGTQFNIRKGHNTLRWLQSGLKLLGEKTTLRWLGSSAVELKVQTSAEPFRHAEVVIVLEPRDIPILWGYYHARGRRDLLIVRGQLRNSLPFELELFDPHCWSAHGAEEQLRFRNWNQLGPLSGTLLAYAAGRPANVAGLLDAVTLNGRTPVLVAFRSTEPNFEVHWNLDDVQGFSADDLFRSLCALPSRAMLP